MWPLLVDIWLLFIDTEIQRTKNKTTCVQQQIPHSSVNSWQNPLFNHSNEELSEWCQLCCCPPLVETFLSSTIDRLRAQVVLFLDRSGIVPAGRRKASVKIATVQVLLRLLKFCGRCQAFPLQDIGLGVQQVVHHFSTAPSLPKSQETDSLFKFKFMRSFRRSIGRPETLPQIVGMGCQQRLVTCRSLVGHLSATHQSLTGHLSAT